MIILEVLFQALGKTKKLGMDHVVSQKDQWDTYVYHKVYEDGKELPRFDIGKGNIASEDSIDRLLRDFESHINEYDAVLINEQTPNSFHTPYAQNQLNKIIEKSADTIWFADCRTLQDTYKKDDP